MPLWITILLQIVWNLPTIIKTLLMILELLKHKPTEQKKAAMADLHTAYVKASAERKKFGRVDSVDLHARLEEILSRLRV